MNPLAIGAIVGGAKGLFDASRDRQEKEAAAKSDAAAIRFSPWSGLNVSHLVGKSYNPQSILSSMLAGGASGLQTGANIDNAFADSDYRKSLADYYKSKLAPTPYSGILSQDITDDYMGLLKDKAQGMGGFNL